jgi:hypothetical protein
VRYSAPLDARKVVTRIKRKFLWLIPYKTTVHEWLVLAPFRFYHDDKNPDTFIQVEAGWQTDLASVPGFFGFVIQKDGEFAQSAVTHDWSYKNRGDVVYRELPDGTLEKLKPLTRSQQDRAFLNGMELLGTSLPIRVAMWRAVRRFGWIRYPKK